MLTGASGGRLLNLCNFSSRLPQLSRLLAGSLFFSLVGAPTVGAADDFEDFGDIAQIVLPLAGAVCAYNADELGSNLAAFGLQTLSVEGTKTLLSDTELGTRPNGGGRGFPSGHTAAAFFGARSISKYCFGDGDVAKKLAVYGIAAAVGASRITSDNHNFGQVVAGAAVGYFFGSLGVGYDGQNVSWTIEYNF